VVELTVKMFVGIIQSDGVDMCTVGRIYNGNIGLKAFGLLDECSGYIKMAFTEKVHSNGSIYVMVFMFEYVLVRFVQG